ncbi:MAG TPA: efflux RND transporter periplasmic adaptor subunit [Caulobacteraceae bacterium]|nr:efflux RND transporter periplasmic adaptor subunit [Caulobacteraceae bacterium]
MLISRRFWAAMLATALLDACGASKPPSPPPPLVLAAQPLQRQVEDWDDFVGQFESPSSVIVRPRVSGYVTAVGFRDGQDVRRGQLLFQIDPRPYQAVYDQAKAQAGHAAAVLADAKVELARAQALFGAHATSQQEVDTRLAAERTALADLGAAEATARTAELNLDFTRVTAPISGRASDSKAMPGNLVTQDQTVLTSIVSLDPIRFRFTGPEAQFLKYKRENLIGAGLQPPVQIRLQDEPDYRWPGRLAFVDNAFDAASGVMSAYALVDNPSGFLTPGMFGHMRLLGSRPYAGLLVPDQAIVTDQSRQVVYVVDGRGVVAQKVVVLGPIVDGLRVIRSGITTSDRVIIDGVQHARPGKPVTVKAGQITPQPAAASAAPEAAAPSSATFATGP